MDEVVPLSGTDTVPAVTTPSFDIAGLEMWLPLRRGARIGVVTEDCARDGFALAGRIAELGATVVQLTPSGWHLLVDAGWPAMPRFRALVGAEPVPPTLAAELLGHCAEVWNVYGPTEATIWSCVHRIREEDTRGSTVPVGHSAGQHPPLRPRPRRAAGPRRHHRVASTWRAARSPTATTAARS